LETFTDSDGNYRLTNVPAGSAKVKAFFTGFPPQANEVIVSAGQTVRHDVTMAGDTVKLSAFVVSTSREMDAAAIAINEQRFASNRVSVVSTQEFGDIAEGNVAEFLKYLPGVSVDALAGNAREISIDGVPSDYVPVTLDGFSLASAGGDNNTRRTVDADMVSINNLSRIEVSYSPTPESPGGALAGSVNMVPRSSFERARPVFNASAYITMRDNAREFDKTPGPFTSPSRKVTPGFDFSYIAPVNRRFGYTLSGGVSSNWAGEPFIQNIRHSVSVATNGTTFPHTPFGQPYLSSFVLRQGGKETRRKSFGATVDYRLTDNDRFSFSFQSSSYFI
ncbi:MAG: TonB-dependent receptor plug domain-containing protein, partial [Phycisphaerales bacterium]|nr:TonB-dependent receptor plug domain-containing protein [Phycisphaerales bacterium]